MPSPGSSSRQRCLQGFPPGRLIQPILHPGRAFDDRIAAALADAEQPQPFDELRAICRVRTATLYERLAAMTTTGRVVKSSEGYCLTG